MRTLKNKSKDDSSLFISGEVIGRVYDKSGNMVHEFKQKNLVVNGAKTSLASGAGGGTNPLSYTPVIKIGTGTTAPSTAQTSLTTTDTAASSTLTERTYSGSTATITYTFHTANQKTYTETGIFFGSIMWSRVLFDNPVTVPTGGYYTHTWKLTFSS